MLWLLLSGCGASWTVDDGDPTVPLPAQRIDGSTADAGFGMRLLRSGNRVVIGAPMAAEVWSRSGREYEGGGGSFTGAGLAALDDGQVLIGAPGANQIVTLGSGAIEAIHEQLGGVIGTNGRRWIASTSAGVRWDDGVVKIFGTRPDSLAILADDTPVLGFARGDVAVWIGDTSIPRSAAGSEEGFAVLVGDLLGDGAERVAVGAPGLNKVDVYDRDGTRITTIQGESGRFGASLALLSPGRLIVGAPMAGDAAGAVFLVEGDTTTELVVGAEPDAELGASVWAGIGNVIAGAPGGAGSAGYVEVLQP